MADSGYCSICDGWPRPGAGHAGARSLVPPRARAAFVRALAEMGFLCWSLSHGPLVLPKFEGGPVIGARPPRCGGRPSLSSPCSVAAFLRHHALSQLLSWLGVAPASAELKKWGSPELSFVYLLVCLAVALLGPGLLLGRREARTEVA